MKGFFFLLTEPPLHFEYMCQIKNSSSVVVGKLVKKQEIIEETKPTMVSRPKNRQTVRQSSIATLSLVQEIQKVEQMQDEIGEDTSRVLEALHKEIACLHLAQSRLNHDAVETI
ncbi:hypothetical protein SUGI_0604550 [Cryptomeria japonica]|nr:hypothetical protein SUGI_0604550 [Cryptomeria japonica]